MTWHRPLPCAEAEGEMGRGVGAWLMHVAKEGGSVHEAQDTVW
jgi:hypothetical protein